MHSRIPNMLTMLRVLLAAGFFVVLEFYSAETPRSWILDLATAIFVVAVLDAVLEGGVGPALTGAGFVVLSKGRNGQGQGQQRESEPVRPSI